MRNYRTEVLKALLETWVRDDADDVLLHQLHPIQESIPLPTSNK
jgi:hypothetical protein